MQIKTWEHRRLVVGSFVYDTLKKILGVPELERIRTKLLEYDYGIIGCYDNPQYLRKTLENLYGNACTEIIEKLKKEASESEHRIWFEEFLERLESAQIVKVSKQKEYSSDYDD